MSYGNWGFTPMKQNFQHQKQNYVQQAQQFVQGYNQNRQAYSVQVPPSKCSMRTHTKTGVDKGVIIYGYKKTRRMGTLKFVAVAADRKYQTTEHTKMVVKVTAGIQEQLYWGTWNVKKQLLYVQGLNLCASPAKNGAWFRKSK